MSKEVLTKQPSQSITLPLPPRALRHARFLVTKVLRGTLLATALIALVACGDDDDPDPQVCVSGTTHACTCASGESGAQLCQNDAWLACVCDGSPVCTEGSTQPCVCTNGASGSQSCSSNSWGACVCQSGDKQHGDVCLAPAFDCGANADLICVVDDPGDGQGICRVPCQNSPECVENDQSWDAGDTSCCDVGNGTSACFAPFSC